MCECRILKGGSLVSDYFGLYFCDFLVPALYKNQGISNTLEGEIASTPSVLRKRVSSKERGIRHLLYIATRILALVWQQSRFAFSQTHKNRVPVMQLVWIGYKF